jgi:hypothetical protein
MQRSQLKTNCPDYWQEISELDQKKYHKLQSRIALFKTRTHQGQGTRKFQGVMKEINDFAIRKDGDDYKRCFVCGIIWLTDAIAVNTHKICSLTGMSRSAINAGFQDLGLLSKNESQAHASDLRQRLQSFGYGNAECRQWTIRVHLNSLPAVQRDSSTFQKPANDARSSHSSISRYELPFHPVEHFRTTVELDLIFQC